MIQKGYGWLLKVFSKKEPQLVVDYLRNKQALFPNSISVKKTPNMTNG
ncbi:DNA alkylation repair protein [Vibrio vulnificus]|nr:DNA alkylation repair protein [Vibrio vulnificus]